MSHGLKLILPKGTEQQTCVEGGCPKDTSGVRISFGKITEPFKLEEICSQTPVQSKSS